MIKTLKNLLKQDKERYSVPRKVQDVIPIQRIWKDGIFQVGSRFSKTYKFTDINYLVASREDKESMFLAYSELLNSLDSGATTKITINNRRLNKANFEQSILMPMRGDSRDVYRREYNQMLLDKATGEPLGCTTVALMRPDSTLAAGATCDDKGAYSLQAAPGEYIIKASLIGYKDSYKNVNVVTGLNEIEPLNMSEDTQSLVRAQRRDRNR